MSTKFPWSNSGSTRLPCSLNIFTVHTVPLRRRLDWWGPREICRHRLVYIQLPCSLNYLQCCAVFSSIEDYCPGFKKLVVGKEVLTPPDLERVFGLTGGVSEIWSIYITVCIIFPLRTYSMVLCHWISCISLVLPTYVPTIPHLYQVSFFVAVELTQVHY